MAPSYLSDAQLRAELLRCQSCETKPCRRGCPAGCSPADFIMAARCGEPSDYRRAAAHILAHNPLGGVCGSVCPDTLCMARCTRRGFDAPVNIPGIQAGIVRRARQLGALPRFEPLPATGERVAVVGAGPAGLGAASVLARAGHTVRVFDTASEAGGMARLIPRERLDPEVLEADVAWLLGLGDVQLVLGERVELPRDLLQRGYAAVIVAAGLGEPVPLDVPGAERAIHWTRVLGGDPPPELRGRRVAVVGDGGVAVDCAEAAIAQGAAHVELFARKALSELAPTRQERERLFAAGVHVSCRVRVTAIRGDGAEVTGLDLCRVELATGQAFHPSRLEDLPHGQQERRDLDVVILCIGAKPGLRCERHPRVFYAGDLEAGPTSVVEALASGKRAGLEVHKMLAGAEEAACPDRGSCADGIGCPKRATCPEWNRQATADGASGGSRARGGLPVSLMTDFFGRSIASPFLLSAGPAGDGYGRVKRAYEAGWAGGVLSAPGGALDRACADLERLRQEFPDRLTLASASGPVTGDFEADARSWEAITHRLDAAGAMGVEYALSQAQGDAVSHDAGTWARLVDRVLAVSDPGVPRLFRLTAAATTDPLLASIAAAFARHPDKLAGVTLAGAPPALTFAPHAAAAGHEATLASAARRGLIVSSDGGPMDYRTAARLLALGARTLQIGAAAVKYGLGVVDELQGGLSFFLAERGMRSVPELVASAAAQAIPPTRGAVCEVNLATCTGCGNCSRCPHLAIALDARGMPTIDRERCVGCALCVQLCLGGSLSLDGPGVRDGVAVAR
jgi:NADPH-dependent glutamate synthase beta subunit-like oxidoreductase/Pyruvate/2-oxoacid:ferredoxin oxidoreductase delta subunit